MTDKEFKRLGRAQLIEIIYKLQLEIDNLTEKNKSLEEALADKRLRIANVGNLAEAALEINDCFRNAQNAAEQYLNEIKIMRAEIELERNKICTGNNTEAINISTETEPEENKDENKDSVVEAIFKEYGLDISDKVK